MKNQLVMHKCSSCGRIKQFDRWITLNDLNTDAKKNLVYLIQSGAVEWMLIICADCLRPRRKEGS